jgi:hypothetical protein
VPPLAAGIARQAAVEDQADAVTAGSTGPLPMSLSLRSGLGFPLNVDDNVFMWSARFRMTGGVQPFSGLPLMIASSLKWTHLETESRSSDLPGASSGVHIFGVGVGASCAVQRGRSAMYVVPVFERIEDIPDFGAYPTLTSELGIKPVRDWPLEMRTGYSHVVMSFREDGQDMHVVLSGGSLGATVSIQWSVHLVARWG